MSPEVAVLVPGDVVIFVVAIVCQDADINMPGLGVNHSGAVGHCAIAGGCAGGNSDCDGDVLWLCWCWGGETAVWVSCSCAAGGYAGGEGDSAGDMCGGACAGEGETVA